MTVVLFLLLLYLSVGILLFFVSQYIRINFRLFFVSIITLLTPTVFFLTSQAYLNSFFTDISGSIFLLPLLIFTLSALVVFAWGYEKRGFGKGRKCIRKIFSQNVNKTFLLTFDDGPHPEFTPSIIKILEENNIKAVFFLVGKAAEENREIVEMLKDSRMETGVHSFSHKPLPFMSTKQIEEEIGKTVSVITEITGSPPRYFRPPWGLYNREVLEIAESYGLKTILWGCSTRDWKERSVSRICRNAIKTIESGTILLFHDGCKEGADRKCTIEALPLIIGELRERGMSSADLRELCS